MRYLIVTLIVAALAPAVIGCHTPTDTDTNTEINPITGRKTAAVTDGN